MKANEGWTMHWTNNNHITVELQHGRGMAGEPMEWLTFKIAETGSPVRFDEIKNSLDENDRVAIEEWLEQIAETNHDTTVTWTR